MSGFRRGRVSSPAGAFHSASFNGASSNMYGNAYPHYGGGSYSFAYSARGSIPSNAVYVGTDSNGGKLFAGRAYHEGDLIPAKVAPSYGGAFVPWGGAEHFKTEYEVLQSTQAAWKYAERGSVPPKALQFGQTKQSENLYMGRALHHGVLIPGKVQPSHGCLYIPYGGQEIPYKEYEVLVLLS